MQLQPFSLVPALLLWAHLFLGPSPSRSVPSHCPTIFSVGNHLYAPPADQISLTIIHAKHLANAHKVFCKEPDSFHGERRLPCNCILNYVSAISLHFEGVLLSLHIKDFAKIKKYRKCNGYRGSQKQLIVLLENKWYSIPQM